MELQEFFHELISIANLPATLLMCLVLLYWMMAIVGIIGIDAFDLDLDLDAELEVDMEMAADADGGGLFGEFLSFMHLGEIPVMIVSTAVVFFMWLLTVISNHYLNSEQNLWLSLIFTAPNLIISMLCAKIVFPLSFNFSRLNRRKSGTN